MLNLYRLGACAVTLGFLLLPAGGAPAAVESKVEPGGSIAFIRAIGTGDASRANVFVMNADGSGVRRLTNGRGQIHAPAWSPNGRRIAYTRRYPVCCSATRKFKTDVFVIGADGGGLRRLTDSRLHIGPPAWSPNGRLIAYGASGFIEGKHQGGVYVMNADGSGKRQLSRRLSSSAPTWSPDGRRVAFSTNGGGIWIAGLDGAGERRAARGYDPAWSPAGETIGSIRAPFGYDTIWVTNADGGGERVLTRHAYNEAGFAWSPDGRRIVYSRERGRGVYLINVDGTGDHRVTSNRRRQDLLAGRFAWSPRGTAIAYSSDRTGGGDIYLVNADGSGGRRLTHDPALDTDPAWSRAP